jgi:hypothetical protein
VTLGAACEGVFEPAGVVLEPHPTIEPRQIRKDTVSKKDTQRPNQNIPQLSINPAPESLFFGSDSAYPQSRVK